MYRKSIFVALFCAFFCAPQESSAQAFLKKLKEKAEDAVTKAVGLDKAHEESNSQQQQPTDDDYSYNEESDEYVESRIDYNRVMIQGDDIVKSSRISKLNWDDPVAPSTKTQPEALLNELPALPSAAQLANPTEDEQILFYRAIKAVTMRVEQLDEQNTCSEAEEKAFIKKHDDMVKNMYKELYGLTDAEVSIFAGETGTDADREKVAQKVVMAQMGASIPSDAAMAELERHKAKMESMGEDAYRVEQANKMKAAAERVARKNEAGLKKYCGLTADEMATAMSSDFESEDGNASMALQKKMMNFRKSLSAADKKAAEEFDKKITAEMQQAMMEASDMKETAKYGEQRKAEQDRQQKAMAEFNALREKERQYMNDVMGMLVEFSGSDFKMRETAKANYMKVSALKKKIYSGAGDSDALFAEAEEMIAKSRESVAQSWIGYLSKSLDKIKKNLPHLVALNRQAAKDGVMPECAQLREPYNQILEAGNILMAAYQDFPAGYPPMYNVELAETIEIADNERFVWPEVVGTVGGNYYESLGIFKAEGNTVYQYVGKNNWKKMPANYRPSSYKPANAPKDDVMTSKDGKRKVIFNAKGRCLMLPEGDVVTPMSIEKRSDAVVWYMIDQQNGNKLIINKCTYKL